MLQPPIPNLRERILVMGGFGTGKTSDWLNIAKWSKETGSDARFYVLDTDASVSHMLTVPGGQYEGLDNVVLYECFDWMEYVGALKASIAAHRPGLDWIVVDFVGTAWEAVQEYYVQERYQADDLAEFFMEQALARSSKAPLDGWKDWSVINRLYKSFQNALIHKHSAHLFLTSGVKVIGDNEDRSVRALFGPHGVRPVGQKHLGHIPHTVLYAQAIRPGEIFVTTIKDRERRILDGTVQQGEFALDYLVNVAGWKLV
ncbi:MAG TPA: AAA family ATPase [Planctomycetota bacterium]|nr:AAA family ATPase [Planctomycetota bacterium]